jgi:hypothetical protein
MVSVLRFSRAGERRLWQRVQADEPDKVVERSEGHEGTHYVDER